MGSGSDGRMGVHHSAVCHFGMQSTAVAHAARLSKHVNGLLALLVTDTAPCEKLQTYSAGRFRRFPIHADACGMLFCAADDNGDAKNGDDGSRGRCAVLISPETRRGLVWAAGTSQRWPRGAAGRQGSGVQQAARPLLRAVDENHPTVRQLHAATPRWLQDRATCCTAVQHAATRRLHTSHCTTTSVLLRCNIVHCGATSCSCDATSCVALQPHAPATQPGRLQLTHACRQ